MNRYKIGDIVTIIGYFVEDTDTVDKVLKENMNMSCCITNYLDDRYDTDMGNSIHPEYSVHVSDSNIRLAIPDEIAEYLLNKI